MTILRFDHYAIRTARFRECRQFYVDVIGLTEGPRPPLSVEGVWLYQGSAALVHIVDANGGKASSGSGRTGYMDHIAFRARGLDEMRERLKRHGATWREASIPSLGLQQLFITDPDGVVLELNYVEDGQAAPERA